MQKCGGRSREEGRETEGGVLKAEGRELGPLLDGFGITVILRGVPRKVRQLIADLERAGFVLRPGKGSHRNYEHPRGSRVTLSGGAGDDARHYQEKLVRRSIEDTQK